MTWQCKLTMECPHWIGAALYMQPITIVWWLWTVSVRLIISQWMSLSQITGDHSVESIISTFQYGVLEHTMGFLKFYHCVKQSLGCRPITPSTSFWYRNILHNI